MKTFATVLFVLVGILFVIVLFPIALAVLWIGENLFLGALTMFMVGLAIVELVKFFMGDTKSIFRSFSDLDDLM